MIRVALLGCGRIGRMHAANLAKHARAGLAAVYDLHSPSAQEVASAHSVPLARDPQEIFSSTEVDAVLIATATESHADYIEMAVASGKPALCEKPIDLNLARVDRCAEAIEGSGLPIQIGFNRRFDPGHRAARDALRRGDIGVLHQVIICSRDPSPPSREYLASSGGLFRDMTIHDFDLARFMLDCDPVEVFALADALIDPALSDDLHDVDTAMITMRTSDGTQCHINNSRAAVYGYDQRVELFGAQGMLLSDNRRPHELRRFSHAKTEVAEPYLHFFIERYHESYVAELTAFVDCIEKGIAPEVGFDDGRKALVLAEAAYQSMTERRIVRVDEIEA